MTSGGYGSVGSGRPRRSLGNKDGRIRGDHVDRGADLPPAHAKVAPAFQVRIGAAHSGELVARPRVGFGQVGRAGEPRANIVK